MASNSNKQSIEKPQPDVVRRIIETSRKPLVFRGLLNDSWPMIAFSPSDWTKLFEGKSLECRVGLRDSSDEEEPQWEGRSCSVQCSYGELVTWANGDKAEGQLELLDPSKHFLYFGYKYMKDLFDERVLSMTDWKDLGYAGKNGKESTFWLGTAGAHTPCHYDTYGCNLVAQVSGRKRWVLFPPEDTPFLQATRVPYEESSVYSRINFEAFGWSEIPSIEGTHPHVVVLLPGDVLFVPRHWWHHVTNLEMSVSVNIWLERPEDEEARLQEALVKFLMVNVSRNLPPELIPELLNPNELDTAELDLEDVQGFIQHTVNRLRESARPQTNDSEVMPPSEPWIIPIPCELIEALPKETEVPERPVPQQDIGPLDVIRAFCHPEVIQTVSRLLKK